MKKILVIRGISAYDVLGRAADEICEGFRKCGYQVDMIVASEPGADDRFIECLEHRDQYVLLPINILFQEICLRMILLEELIL